MGGGSVAKFSEIPDKIREIETSGSYTVRVYFYALFGDGGYYGDDISHIIDFKVRENDSSGKVLLNISERKNSPTTTDTYEYTFETSANTVYIESYSYADFPGAGAAATATLTDLKKHKTILIKASYGGSSPARYAD